MNFLAKNLNYLRKKKGLNQGKIQASIGFKRNTWSNWENKVSEPNIDNIISISQFFGIDVGKLINVDLENAGIEEIEVEKRSVQIAGDNAGNNAGNKSKKYPENNKLTIVQDNGSREVFRMPQVITVDNSGEENVIMVPVRARAGYLNGYGDPEFISSLPTYRLPGINNGTFRLFEVDGYSMQPTFEDKDVLVTKFVENLDSIKDDRIYVVVTKSQGVVVKAVINRLKTDNKLILKSDNKKHNGEFADIVLDPEEVLEMWYGVLFMSRYMRRPTDMYNRMIDVEGRLALMEHELKKRQ